MGGGINRNVFRNSGPGDFRDNRFRGVVVEMPSFPEGLDAKSKPFYVNQETKIRVFKQLTAI